MNTKTTCLLFLAAIPLARLAMPAGDVKESAAPPGSRAVRVDYDNDGRVDVYVIEPSGRARLLVQADDGSLEDRTRAAGLDGVGAVDGAFWKDLTNDRWQDLIVLRPDGRLGLFVSDGEVFADFTEALGPAAALSCVALAQEDYDLNGWFDLGLWTADGGTKVVLNSGDLRFELRDAGPWALGPAPGGGGLAPGVPGQNSLVTGGGSGAPSSLAGGACASQISDQVTAQCLNASTTPALGRLYPLSSDLFVQNTTGRVGINTTTPTQRLDVAGLVRATGGFQFPDGSIQTTATLVGPAGAPGSQGPEGAPGTTLPPGTILMSAASAAPEGFVLCDGTVYLWDENPELRAAIGTTYGGTVGVDYRVPDLKQRFPLGKAVSGTGSVLGSVGGSIDHTHASAVHQHDMSGHTHAGPNHTHGMTHDHTVPAHHHNAQGAGADINIITNSSSEHPHDIGGRENGEPGPAGQNRFMIANNVGNATRINAGSGSQPGAAGQHAHDHASVQGRVGNVSTGSNGDATFTTGGSSAGSTGTGGTQQTGGPSINSTGSTTPPATGTANPPYQVVNFIIKT